MAEQIPAPVSGDERGPTTAGAAPATSSTDSGPGATAPQASPATAVESGPGSRGDLDAGTYEVIRRRLTRLGADLGQRLEQLNAARRETFGTIELGLLGTERISTENNCLPRDMVAIGNRLLFGYNVFMGLKSETAISDVFALYQYEGGSFKPQPLDLITDARFIADFKEVYRFYRSTLFVKFAVVGTSLFMVFQTGKQTTDVRCFRFEIRPDHTLTYCDARSEHLYKLPPQHEFEWTRTTRDLFRTGTHPHIAIDDRLFVETVGGDLTIKIEDNTETGEGIYSEPVDNRDQTLDDAEIYYAIVGSLILLKIRPYQEKDFRYLVYSDKMRRVVRIEGVASACVLLPDGHGLISPRGFYLQSGDWKEFDATLGSMHFEKRIASPNGEDTLFVFHSREHGQYVLFSYNIISQQVATPMLCGGFSLFEDGRMVLFKDAREPSKHHAVQLWRTPFVGPNFIAPPPAKESYLYKLGNRDVVRAMSECREVLNLIGKDDTYANLFVDLARKAGDVIDTYFWLDHAEAGRPREVLVEIKAAATSAIDEHEKVLATKRETRAATKRVQRDLHETGQFVASTRFETLDAFVAALGRLRALRGEIIALRERRYVDLALIGQMEAEVEAHHADVARRCLEFLLGPDALEPYRERVGTISDRIPALGKVTEGRAVEADTTRLANDLEMLTEVISNLPFDDVTARTAIVERISVIFAHLNQVRSRLKNRVQELARAEGIAEFGAQTKLLHQSVENLLELATTPEKCDELLTRLMLQVEDLEGRFADFDEFVAQITEKREQILGTFEARKVALIEARTRRADAMLATAERILKGVRGRCAALTEVNAIHAFFAADLMVDKVRSLVKELRELGDPVKADDLEGRLKTAREDAIRQLRDRQELFVGGDDLIRFGRHQFSVNRQPLDLTMVPRGEGMAIHLTGTNFFDPVTDESFAATRAAWSQEVVSENAEVYRAEYLAWQVFRALTGPTADRELTAALADDADGWRSRVQRVMAPRFDEGYVKGVHDHDAALIAAALTRCHQDLGLLRHGPRARALARLFWVHFRASARSLVAAKLKGAGLIERMFPTTAPSANYTEELRSLLSRFIAMTSLFPETLVDDAADYLFAVESQGRRFAISREATTILERFQGCLHDRNLTDAFASAVANVASNPVSAYHLLRDWVDAFLRVDGQPWELDYRDEVATTLFARGSDDCDVIAAESRHELAGLIGSHPVLDQGRYRLDYHGFVDRLGRFEREVVPRFNRYSRLKQELLAKARIDLRLDEFRPRVLSSFVRNRLIDQVYLPLIGDNLAKQIGTVGEGKRSDRSGLLMLISPPGYGKTTLMEYIANRLGLVFMKVNGPALGRRVTSFDPAEATNAAARQELEKLNLGFEMGDNVMIYLDDIQHCSPELLEKFISLCDAQRQVEGVFRRRPRSYDFRGRKVAVVMAGNPYTESGERFKLPDMLANRADTYNLGDIVGDHREAFELSYLENAVTSNPVLNRLNAYGPSEVAAVIRLAMTGSPEGITFAGNHSAADLNDYVGTMRKLMRVREVVLTVNQEYIRSASQAESYRTEPEFKLQGSYRNLNRIAEKIVPVMNDAEVETVIESHYQNECQTLTTAAEQNLLKFKELLGRLSPVEAERWAAIKATYRKNLQLKGLGDDRTAQMLAQLTAVADGLHAIHDAIAGAAGRAPQDAAPGAAAPTASGPTIGRSDGGPRRARCPDDRPS